MGERPHFRSGGRRTVHLPVKFRLGSTSEHGVLEHSGKTVDLGMGGAFIESATVPEVGASVELLLSSPTAWEVLEIPGRVAWHRARSSSGHGFGMRFEELSPTVASALFELLQSVGFLDQGAQRA